MHSVINRSPAHLVEEVLIQNLIFLAKIYITSSWPIRTKGGVDLGDAGDHGDACEVAGDPGERQQRWLGDCEGGGEAAEVKLFSYINF